jgi:regulatory protein
MYARKPSRESKPLNEETLRELALFYLGKFATTRAKLADYLGRKLRQRGWEGDAPADVDRLVEHLASSGLVDDALYALSKSRSLTQRGYGAGRVRQALRAAGVDEDEGAPANALAGEEAAASALRFARRKRIGPFADAIPDRKARERALAAMVRAGHPFDLARALVDAEPGSDVDLDELRAKFR